MTRARRSLSHRAAAASEDLPADAGGRHGRHLPGSTATDDVERAEYVADFGRPSVSEVASVAALAAPPSASGGCGIAMLVGAVPEMVFLNQGVSGPILFDWPGVACGVMVAAALAHLLGPVFGRPRLAPTWSLALALVAPIVLVQRIVSLIDLGVSDPFPGHPETMILAGVEAFLVLVVLLPLIRLGRRTLGGLPATRTGADGSAALNSSLL